MGDLPHSPVLSSSPSPVRFSFFSGQSGNLKQWLNICERALELRRYPSSAWP